MSTDLSTCKHICQNVSMLVREAGGRLIERSGPQFKVTYYQTYIFNIFFEYFHIFIYIYIYIYFHSFSYMFQHFPIFFLWSPMKPLLKMCVYIYIYIYMYPCAHLTTSPCPPPVAAVPHCCRCCFSQDWATNSKSWCPHGTTFIHIIQRAA